MTGSKKPMGQLHGKVRFPVRRQGASGHLLLLVLSFAASVTLTRLFLELTGYPRLGSGTFHIAHVLWGGLLLFIAALLPLLLANRWAFTVAALLAGMGVGLFIDEVGKFITSGNDYFYPPAAPIIYVFFLLTVLVYLQIRRPLSRDPRAVFYRAFEDLQEVLDRDLDPEERAGLVAELRSVATDKSNPDLAQLAVELLQFLEHDRLYLVVPRSRLMDRLQANLLRLEGTWLSRSRFRMILAGGGIGLGIMQLTGIVNVILALGASVRMEQLMSEWILHSLVSSKAALGWFLVRIGLEGVAGFVLVLAAVLLILRRDHHAIALTILGLLLSLAGVNLLKFYFEQFSTIFSAGVQFFFLLAALRYRGKYLPPPAVGGAEGRVRNRRMKMQ